MSTRSLISYIVAALAVAALVWGVMLLSDTPPTVPSSRLVENLASSDVEKVGKTLRSLAERKDPVAVPAALPLLRNEDPFVWIHAALYLGAVQRAEAVPYLIQAGLKKYEWAYSDARKSLVAITGQDFGTDFEKWRVWWDDTNPAARIEPAGSSSTPDPPAQRTPGFL